MKKSLKIVLSVIVILFVLITILMVWQWDNIKAIYMGIAYSDEKIETKIDSTKEKLGKELEKEGIVVDQKIIEGFSKEDEEKLAKGELTVDEAVEKLFGSEEKDDNENKQADNQTAQEQNDYSEQTQTKTENVSAESSNTAENNQQTENNSNAKGLIEAAVKEMYTLKATFVQKLAVIERSAKRMYIAEGMTKEKKLEIADRVMPQLIEAEKECDVKVEAVLSKLKTDLEAIGADISVVEYIREQYNNEKQLQKSKYISKYM